MTLEQRIEMLERVERLHKQKIRELEEELAREKSKKEELQFRIDNELEPRLKHEAQSYDAWVSSDKAAEACEAFAYKIEELVDMVKENPKYFAFENADGDVIERVLYCIKKSLYLD